MPLIVGLTSFPNPSKKIWKTDILEHENEWLENGDNHQ